MPSTLPPLSIKPEVSRLLSGFLLISHSVSALVVGLMPQWHSGLKLLVGLIIASSLGYYWRWHIQRKTARAVLALTLYTPNTWRLYTPQGAQFAALDDSSFISPYLMVLNLRTKPHQLHTLILLRDSLAPALWRELYMRLRFA